MQQENGLNNRTDNEVSQEQVKQQVKDDSNHATSKNGVSQQQNVANALDKSGQREDKREEQSEERMRQQMAAIAHTKAVATRKLELAFIAFEDILRILHSTNMKNQAHLKKNIYEIEMICKNVILELKGL